MNHIQRKRHLYTWAILAILLPIGFVMALWARPTMSISKEKKEFQPPAMPNIVRSTGEESIVVNLRSSATNLPPTQLEIQLKQQLGAPALGVYLTNSSGIKDVKGLPLVGQVSSQGIYRFELTPELANMSTLVLFDPLHKSIYQTISLNP